MIGLMINKKTFTSFPKYLDVGDWKVPNIVSDRRLACWYCIKTGHLSVVCLGKKVSVENPDIENYDALLSTLIVP